MSKAGLTEEKKALVLSFVSVGGVSTRRVHAEVNHGGCSLFNRGTYCWTFSRVMAVLVILHREGLVDMEKTSGGAVWRKHVE